MKHLRNAVIGIFAVVFVALMLAIFYPEALPAQSAGYVHSLYVRNTATFRGAVTFLSTVSWADSTFGHLVAQDSARMGFTTINGKLTLRDSLRTGNYVEINSKEIVRDSLRVGNTFTLNGSMVAKDSIKFGSTGLSVLYWKTGGAGKDTLRFRDHLGNVKDVAP